MNIKYFIVNAIKNNDKFNLYTFLYSPLLIPFVGVFISEKMDINNFVKQLKKFFEIQYYLLFPESLNMKDFNGCGLTSSSINLRRNYTDGLEVRISDIFTFKINDDV